LFGKGGDRAQENGGLLEVGQVRSRRDDHQLRTRERRVDLAREADRRAGVLLAHHPSVGHFTSFSRAVTLICECGAAADMPGTAWRGSSRSRAP